MIKKWIFCNSISSFLFMFQSLLLFFVSIRFFSCFIHEHPEWGSSVAKWQQNYFECLNGHRYMQNNKRAKLGRGLKKWCKGFWWCIMPSYLISLYQSMHRQMEDIVAPKRGVLSINSIFFMITIFCNQHESFKSVDILLQ